MKIINNSNDDSLLNIQRFPFFSERLYNLDLYFIISSILKHTEDPE